GATRGVVIRELLVEAATVGLVAGTLGVGLAKFGVSGLRARAIELAAAERGRGRWSGRCFLRDYLDCHGPAVRHGPGVAGRTRAVDRCAQAGRTGYGISAASSAPGWARRIADGGRAGVVDGHGASRRELRSFPTHVYGVSAGLRADGRDCNAARALRDARAAGGVRRALGGCTRPARQHSVSERERYLAVRRQQQCSRIQCGW